MYVLIGCVHKVPSLRSAYTICIRHGHEHLVQFTKPLVLSDKCTVFKVKSHCVIRCLCMNNLAV